MQHEYMCVHEYLVGMSACNEASWMHSCTGFVLVRSTGAEPGYSLKKYHCHVVSHTLSHVLSHRMRVASRVCWVGLSVHVVVFGAPTLSSLLNTSHITLPYLCACVPERAQCGPQAVVLPVMICASVCTCLVQ